jgi:hypothetical protein
VLGAGIEPAHSEEYRILSPVRLPIPPPEHFEKDTRIHHIIQRGKLIFFFQRTFPVIQFSRGKKGKTHGTVRLDNLDSDRRIDGCS